MESFHSSSERAVKQELSAHCTLIAVAGLFASRCERQFQTRQEETGRAPTRANFNHSLSAVERELEALLHQAPQLRVILNRVLENASWGPQRERPGRSYPHRSRSPSKKWRDCKPAEIAAADSTALSCRQFAELKRVRLNYSANAIGYREDKYFGVCRS